MRSSTAILITDGEHRAALAATRSLGRAGYRVIVASSRPHCLAGASRWATAHWQTPDPLDDPAGFVSMLEQRAADSHYQVLLPITDQSIAPVLAARSRFSGVAIPFPELEAWRRISDKAALTGAAARLDIRVPEQTVVASPDQIGELEGLGFPVVAKPARSLVQTRTGPAKFSVRHAREKAELKAALDRLPAEAWPVLIQRRIVGPGLGVFLLMNQGRVLASFGHRRILEKPPSGGVSVCSESVGVPPELMERSAALLEHFAWSGVAMVEYKLERETGTPFLMEVNGRLWGSLQLAIDAGVDFPRLLVDQALGKPVYAPPAWRIGLRCRWRLGEADHLLARLRQSGNALPPDIPSLSTAIRHALLPAWGANQRGEVFRWNDPRPAFREALDWIQGR